ncbi:hypothetical protein HPP92_012190 [Vanilla planifolia]|uniref:Uncharacterized protein n=1 Tax=Vanilla planifolia TaxID=51239 RepID=A0A835R8I8_VANPL|nr:hypothetical protein HPP92_012190 [Vanilla planifolia]
MPAPPGRAIARVPPLLAGRPRACTALCVQLTPAFLKGRAHYMHLFKFFPHGLVKRDVRMVHQLGNGTRIGTRDLRACFVVDVVHGMGCMDWNLENGGLISGVRHH